MLKIRLTRGGSKRRPYYHVVVADARCPRDGRFLEKLGSYNPLLESANENRLVLNKERIQHWLSVGAQPTDRIEKFLVDAGLLKASPRPEQTKKNLPKAKAQEKMKIILKFIDEHSAARVVSEDYDFQRFFDTENN